MHLSILTSLNEHSKLADDRLKIDIPTLVIWGRSDKVNPVRYAQKFKILKSKIVIIDNCGHYPHIEKPSEFSNIVLDFIKLND
jgi:2-hydroxy-6-oxonona-2,4-dienedioate hydrolase